VSYSFLSASIPLSSLETFARTGKINNKFANYAIRIDSKQLAQLQQLLSTKIPLDSVAVSQILHTSIGEKLLRHLGQVIQTDGETSSFDDLRNAMIVAAKNHPKTFTPLDVIQQLLTKAAYIKLDEALVLLREANQFVEQTHDASTTINQESNQESALETLEAEFPFDLSGSENLQEPGRLTCQKQNLKPYSPEGDVFGDRKISIDLYVPCSRTRHPILIISHGLGSDRSSFRYLAEHLASHGFAVVVPESPGSNLSWLTAFLKGTQRYIIPPQEFVNRPIDVSNLLNKLEELSSHDSKLKGRLDFQNAGIVGHSLGGYTALALAGATFQSQHLTAMCQASQNSLNLSLLLQCMATQLPQLPSHLSDPRIKAVIAINPFGSAIFGQAGLSQIKAPTMIIASSADMLAPALTEQIQPFCWLTTRNKYLALIAGATHYSALDRSSNGAIPVFPFPLTTNPPPMQQYPPPVHQYIKALSVAFFKTHLMNQQQYRSYLNAGYAEAISQSPVQLALVKTLSTSDLSKNLEESLKVFFFCLYLFHSRYRIRQATRRG
jgi:predicted dienelactone hydrolase